MPSERSERLGSGSRTVATQVGRFALAGVVALGILGLATSIASRRLGEREAVADARTTAVIKAIDVVEPALTDGVLVGDADALADLDAVVTSEVLDESLVRVKVWAGDGTVLYSDEPRLVGTRWSLAADEVESLSTGLIKAETSDLDEPENQYEVGFDELLEVYLPINTPDGTPVLFEAYFRYSLVEQSRNDLWRSFAPIALGSLVLLQVVQIPLAWSLARSLRQRHAEREQLLQRVIEVGDTERRRVASDLHDGAVQDLAGVALMLSGAARESGTGADPALLDEAADGIRGAIRQLRSLIAEIYPPDFDDVPLESALADLLAGAAEQGIETDLHSTGAEPPPAAARLLYRVAQEAVRNTVAHAQARSLRMQVDGGAGQHRLTVVDDGVGFDAASVRERRAEGHLGLAAISGLVGDAGGTVTVVSEPGAGTTVTVVVPR